MLSSQTTSGCPRGGMKRFLVFKFTVVVSRSNMLPPSEPFHSSGRNDSRSGAYALGRTLDQGHKSASRKRSFFEGRVRSHLREGCFRATSALTTAILSYTGNPRIFATSVTATPVGRRMRWHNSGSRGSITAPRNGVICGLSGPSQFMEDLIPTAELMRAAVQISPCPEECTRTGCTEWPAGQTGRHYSAE